MAGSINKVILVGNLGRDPEVRHSQNGTKIVTLSVATSERWKDAASGENRDRTEWHRVVIFNERLADVAEKYLKKGITTYFEGQLQTRKWTDQTGKERYTTEVVLPRFRGELTILSSDRTDHVSEPPASSYDVGEISEQKHRSAPNFDSEPSSDQRRSSAPSGFTQNHDDLDDEIPF